MRVLRAKLKDYRGTEHREIEFDPGVTVLEGPNEVGKSSIAEALDLLFQFKDSSKHRAVKGAIPVNRDESPEVEFEIESGKYHFVYRKRFGKGARTELEVSQPRPESLTGDAAHERAEQILEETLDVDLWRALQVHQGVGIGQADLKDSAALSRALDEASGSNAAGAAEGALFDRVDQEYQRYFTPKGHQKAVLSDGAKKIAELKEDLEDHESEERQLRRDVEEHARLASRLKKVEEQVPGLVQDLQAQEKAWTEVEKLSGEVDKSTGQLERLELEARGFATAKAQREQLAKKLSESEDRVSDLRKEHAEVLGPLKKLRKKLGKAKDDLGAVQAAVEKAEALHLLRGGDETYLRAKLEAERLEERHQRVVKIREKVRAAKGVLETNQLTDDELERIREADVEVRQLTKRVAEAGPQLQARALGKISILIDGDEVALKKGDVEERSIPRPTTVTIPDRLEIALTPGASAEDLQEELQAAVRDRDGLLREHGADSVAAARQANTARNQAERDVAEADGLIEQDLRDLTFEELEVKRDSCRAVVDKHEADRAAKPPIPKTLETARETASEAERAVKEARNREREAGNLQRRLAEQAEENGENETRLSAQIGAEVDAANGITSELEAARQEISDKALEGQLDAAEVEASRAKAQTDALTQKLREENPEQAKARRDAARASRESAREDLTEVRLDLNTVETRLDTLQEKGLFELLERVRSQLDHARDSHSRLERRANAAHLLYKTLSSHRDEARRRYLQPLTTRVETLGRVVFGTSFRVILKDSLTIESRTLEGATIPFEDLSKGAQEQLGLLARLAVAMIVSEDEGVPLILDDTLGYSDPARMQTMAATIGRASEKCQIIILTCSPDRFRGIPGARLERISHGS